MLRISTILVKGSGFLSLIFLFLSAEHAAKSISYAVTKRPKELLLELGQIEKDLGLEIDRDIAYTLEHGGLVEGANSAYKGVLYHLERVLHIIPQADIIEEHHAVPAKSSDSSDGPSNGERQVLEESPQKTERKPKEELPDPEILPVEPTYAPEVLHPHNHQWLLNPVNKCKRENPTFVVLIRSQEANYQLREAVRKTWCSKSEKPDFSCVFLVGRDHTLPKEKIKLEHNHYHDILMEDFEDDKDIEKVLMGLRWIENYCKEPKYILKTNDDVWVNIKRFEDYFESNTIEEQFFGGKCVIEMPERDRKSKRFVSEEDFPGNHYPASCRDGGYLMTSNLAGKIYEKSLEIVPPVKFEDIYFGFVLHALGLFTRSTSGFDFGKFVLQRACEYKTNAFTLTLGGKNTNSKTNNLQQLHERIQKC